MPCLLSSQSPRSSKYPKNLGLHAVFQRFSAAFWTCASCCIRPKAARPHTQQATLEASTNNQNCKTFKWIAPSVPGPCQWLGLMRTTSLGTGRSSLPTSRRVVGGSFLPRATLWTQLPLRRPWPGRLWQVCHGPAISAGGRGLLTTPNKEMRQRMGVQTSFLAPHMWKQRVHTRWKLERKGENLAQQANGCR